MFLFIFDFHSIMFCFGISLKVDAREERDRRRELRGMGKRITLTLHPSQLRRSPARTA